MSKKRGKKQYLKWTPWADKLISKYLDTPMTKAVSEEIAGKLDDGNGGKVEAYQVRGRLKYLKQVRRDKLRVEEGTTDKEAPVPALTKEELEIKARIKALRETNSQLRVKSEQLDQHLAETKVKLSSSDTARQKLRMQIHDHLAKIDRLMLEVSEKDTYLAKAEEWKVTNQKLKKKLNRSYILLGLTAIGVAVLLVIGGRL